MKLPLECLEGEVSGEILKDVFHQFSPKTLVFFRNSTEPGLFSQVFSIRGKGIHPSFGEGSLIVWLRGLNYPGVILNQASLSSE